MSRKNLIFICTDQLRFDALSVNGNRHVQTTHLDRIAEHGATLVRHYTPNQICSPSRATMATGLYPRHHGLWRNGVALDPTLPTLWNGLRTSGYATYAVGKLHYQPLLAPAERDMPESLAWWERHDGGNWPADFYGFEQVRLVLGDANESVHAGHYARWLAARRPDAKALYAPEAPRSEQARDLPEVWKCAVAPELHYNHWIADQAISFIEGHDGSEGRPFCLYVSFPDPHHPFAPPWPYADMFSPADMPTPTSVPGELERMPAYLQISDDPRKQAYIGAGETVREQGFMLRTEGISADTLATAIAHTYGSVKMIDDAIGRILAALQRSGRAEDTYLVLTSDHGEFLGDHGLLRKGPPPYRQLLQVPLLISGPAVRPGLRSDALTSHLDLYPTLLSLLGVTPGASDGLDLSPLLAGTCQDVRDELFAEYHPRQDHSLYNRSLITKDWRYTCYPNHPEWGELFDLRADPWEHHNLLGETDQQARSQALQRRLDQDFPTSPEVTAEILAPY